MDVVSMHQAKSSLSQLVNRVEGGEIIYIGAYGKAQAKIVALDHEEKPVKKFGLLAGKLQVPDDFDEPLPDSVISEFEGR